MMTTDKVFFAYMAVIGSTVGAVLVLAPAVGDFWLKPYFWVVIAVVLFDGATYLRGRSKSGATMLSMEARLLGFVIGIVLMVAVPTLAGSSAQFF
jgi:hypothetical protein